VWDSFARWVPHQMSGRGVALVAMNWTDFDHDGQSTLVLSLVTGHGRAAPLLWLTVWKEEIATRGPANRTSGAMVYVIFLTRPRCDPDRPERRLTSGRDATVTPT